MQPTKLAFEQADAEGNVVAGVSYDALAGNGGEFSISQGANTVTFPAAQAALLKAALAEVSNVIDQRTKSG